MPPPSRGWDGAHLGDDGFLLLDLLVRHFLVVGRELTRERERRDRRLICEINARV